jgi:hypothetical protein
LAGDWTLEEGKKKMKKKYNPEPLATLLEKRNLLTIIFKIS